MEPSFDSLESSLSIEDSLLHSSNIDHLYHTYLGSMDTFPAAYGGSDHYSTGQRDLQCQSLHDRAVRQRGAAVETFHNVSVSDWRGEVRHSAPGVSGSYLLLACARCCVNILV